MTLRPDQLREGLICHLTDHVAAEPPAVAVELDQAVIGKGLNGDETVVTEGQLLLTNGARVAPRPPAQAGS